MGQGRRPEPGVGAGPRGNKRRRWAEEAHGAEPMPKAGASRGERAPAAASRSGARRAERAPVGPQGAARGPRAPGEERGPGSGGGPRAPLGAGGGGKPAGWQGSGRSQAPAEAIPGEEPWKKDRRNGGRKKGKGGWPGCVKPWKIQGGEIRKRIW
uniref:Uncharacterized protein n=1 Tax=Phyllostachys edulis TaxID=38705 RepID=D3IVP6_PHYED|nr:hypothetical protein [Phyllostachys edulis]